MGSAQEVEDPVDNYATFIARLDEAIATLRLRRASIDQVKPLLVLLHKQNQTGFTLWSERRLHVDELLTKDHNNPASFKHLAELLETARTLERKFQGRSHRIQGQLQRMEDSRKNVERSLIDLEKSKAKLNMSLTLTKDREILNHAITALDNVSGSPGTRANDNGFIVDLKSARNAIFLAEALLEVKE